MTIEEVTTAVIKFRDDRDWSQFHNAKDLSLAISIEAGELNELFLWKNPDSVNAEKVKEELADVFTYSLMLAHKYGLNVQEIIMEKLKKSGEKYPVDKAKGNATKYNEF